MKIKLIPDPGNAPWLGDLSQLPRSTKRWQKGPSRRYRCADFPGIVIAHCGHPTAHRPYYFIGIDTLRKVRLLEDAKAVVEALAAGLIDVENL